MNRSPQMELLRVGTTRAPAVVPMLRSFAHFEPSRQKIGSTTASTGRLFEAAMIFYRLI
jgi:hypothetical protein